jgi:hypothetical protein
MRKILLSIVVLVLMVMNAQAWPVINKGTITIVVTTKGMQESYEIYLDDKDLNQFYYLPRKVRLVEYKDKNGKMRPKFTIIKYQYKDPKTKEPREGGNATFAYTFGAEAESEAQMMTELKKQNKNARLKCVPIKSSTVILRSQNGEYMTNVKGIENTTGATTSDATATTGSSITTTGSTTIAGATSTSQEMVMDIPLSVLGADVYSAITKGASGIAMAINFKFNAYNPPCGITVKGNTQSIYNYFNDTKSVNVEAGGMFKTIGLGGSYGSDKQNLKESLSQNFGLIITDDGCEESTNSKSPLATVSFDGILTTIQGLIFKPDAIKELQQEVKKAEETSPDKKSFFDKVKDLGKTFYVEGKFKKALKNINQSTNTTINFKYDKKVLVEVPSTAEGLLGLSEYNLTKEELEAHIILIQAGNWPKALFGLPSAIAPELGIRNMTVQIAYTDPTTKQKRTDGRKWSIDKKTWVDVYDKPAPCIFFELLGVKTPLEDLEFEASLNIASNIPGNTIKVSKKVKAYNGEDAETFGLIEQLIQEVHVDGSLLTYNKVNGNTVGLSRVEVRFLQGDKIVKKNIAPTNVNGQLTFPNPNVFILPIPDGSVKTELDITFITSTGTSKKSLQSGVLKEFDFQLDDFEWQKQE